MTESAPIIHHVSESPTVQQALAELRVKIDAVDSQLLLLLNQRAKIVQKVGELKQREGLPIYVPAREEQLLRNLVEQSKGPLSVESIRAIYREIVSASRAVEKEVVIACIGPEGGLTHQAARSRFGSSVKYVFFREASDVFDRVSKNEADCGVIPIETSELRLAARSLDDLTETELNVCADITLQAQSKDGEGTGRFLVLGRTFNPPSGFDRTLIALRVEDKPGALVSALEPFKEHSINLSHLASRPAAKGSQDLFFFVEAEGHFRELQSNDVFRELSKRCRAVKVLGSYPKQD